MSGQVRTAAGLFAVTVLVRFAYHAFTGYTADDAFITFRYAENLALGHGFVYNAGERVLGTSTPLFTLVLTLTTLFRVPVIWGALAVSLIASGLTAAVLYRYARAWRMTHFSMLPALMYIFWPRSITSETSGMEAALFTLFVTAAFYYQHKRLEIYALGMATLASVTRPEGIGLVLLLVGYNVYRQRRLWATYIMTPLLILGPWLLFAWLYFGSPVPNSVSAKLALYSRFGTMTPLDSAAYLLGLHTPFGWVILPLFLLGAWSVYRTQKSGRLEVVWIAGVLLFFTLSRTHIFHWYITPIYPIWLLFVGATIQYLFGLMRLPANRTRLAAAVVGSLLMAGLAFGIHRQAVYYRNYQVTLERIHREVGYYLAGATEASATIAAEDIGYLGYYSGRRILDRDGLVSPEVIPYNRDGRYLELLLDTQPQFVVAAKVSSSSPFTEDPRFTSEYQLEKSFAYDDHEYRVYRRVS